jgi:Protein of unknown function (DUF1553)/Protein of unknown function (DUF1549)
MILQAWNLFVVLAVLSGVVSATAAGPKRLHWAFRPIHRPAVPTVKSTAGLRTPIDAFIRARLERKGIAMQREASRRELIRRAKFDLLGLPPTPREIDAFLADKRPDAYERLIDRFLASPRYGETWGRMWLDLVRFAETAGFNADPDRPLAYKYRDYVIRSFNANKPYTRFVAEQLAGDELYPDSVDALIATGYNRMWPDESNASDVLLARQDVLNDLTRNVGAVFLGVSIGCCQCHDHKFDPLPQTDFYRLQAFFAGIVPVDRVPIGTQRELVAYRKKLVAWKERTKSVRDELHALEAKAKARAAAIKRRKFPPRVLKAIDTAKEDRTALDWQLTFFSERQIVVKEKDILKKLKPEQRKRRIALHKQLADLQKRKPKPPATAAVMATIELPSGPAKTYRLAGGSYTKPDELLQPGFLAVTVGKPTEPAEIHSPRSGTSGRRSTLVKWLFDRKNPLTARVMVNRIWQGHFGRGLVSNANDLGTQTPPPSHPLLLDWLADEFVRSGWDVKRMHRLIMLSAAYRQSTRRTAFQGRPERRNSLGTALEGRPTAAQIDPGNTLYWHYPRQRLTAERIRDSLLFVAGKLSQKMFGRGVKPTLPPKFSARHAWKPSKDPRERNRRSVYIYAKRNLPYPLLKAFDLPDMHESCARRAVTTIAPQALTLLNSGLVLDAATSFADGILRDVSETELEEIVKQAYRHAFGRLPSVAETREAVAFIQRQEELVKKSGGQTKSTRSPRQRAVIDFCHALLNANEFLFVE